MDCRASKRRGGVRRLVTPPRPAFTRTMDRGRVRQSSEGKARAVSQILRGMEQEGSRADHRLLCEQLSVPPTGAPAADQLTTLSWLLVPQPLAPSSTVSPGAYFRYHQHQPSLTSV